jgi:hypothetical protein
MSSPRAESLACSLPVCISRSRLDDAPLSERDEALNAELERDLRIGEAEPTE